MLGSVQLPGLGQPSQTACVEIHINRDGSYRYRMIILEQKGTMLQISSKPEEVTLLNDLLQLVKKGMPTVLVITGKGVLVKKVSQAAGKSDSDLLHSLFPDTKSADFIVERIKSLKNDVIISVARKTLIEQTVAQLLKGNVSIVDIFLGPLVLSDIVPIIESKGEVIQASGFKVRMEDRGVIDLESTEDENSDPVDCGGIPVDSRSLLCFAAGFRFLVINRRKSYSDVEQIRESSENYHFTTLVTKGIVASVLVIFLILLVNFIVFDQYHSRANALSVKVEQHANIIVQIDSLKIRINRRENFLRESGLISKTRISYFADRFASSLPQEITLTELTVFPISFKKDTEKTEPDYIPGVLKATMVVSRSSVLNEWLKSMEQKEWIKSVELTDYKAINDRQAMVKLNLTIRG